MTAPKRKLHHIYKVVQGLNLKLLIFLFVLSSFISLIALRSNNLTMLRLREAVFVADQSGGDVDTALNELRSYVYSHMNTDLNTGISVKPPIQLKTTYEKLVDVEKTQVRIKNEELVETAAAECLKRFPPGFIEERTRCVDDFLSKNTVREQSIPKELYQFDFASPSWSPDLAGLSIVLSLMLAVTIILRVGSVLVLKQLAT